MSSPSMCDHQYLAGLHYRSPRARSHTRKNTDSKLRLRLSLSFPLITSFSCHPLELFDFPKNLPSTLKSINVPYPQILLIVPQIFVRIFTNHPTSKTPSDQQDRADQSPCRTSSPELPAETSVRRSGHTRCASVLRHGKPRKSSTF